MTTTQPLQGPCSFCLRTVDNTDPDHQITVVGGYRRVECALRGDKPLG